MKKTFSTFLVLVLFVLSIYGNPPNILLITADDMNWNSVGVYNSTVAGTTPNIDQLARQGMKFDYAYVQMAMCTPSRQVMLSGCHSHQTMTRGFTEIERTGPALPDLLKENGYFIANLNKQQDYYDWDVALTEDSTGMGRDILYQKKAVSEIIEKAGDSPWFIMMNFNDPHRPFHRDDYENSSGKIGEAWKKGKISTPSRVFKPHEVTIPGFLPDLPLVREEMAQYYSSVRRADDGVGAVLKALENSGQRDNTIVIFISDHGISMPYSKLNCYQTSLRVPLIIRYPPIVKAQSRDYKHIVSAVDLAPTLLDIAGIDIPSNMAGRSFLPVLEGKPQDNRDFTVGYYYRNLRQDNMFPEFAIHMRDWVYIYNPWVDGQKEVHNSDYTFSKTLKAIWDAAETSPSIKKRSDFHKYRIIEELYNVRQDPNSLINLAYDEEFAGKISQMHELLVQWMEETEHPALELMKDPYNQKLIDEYMSWEKDNAVKQIDEIMELTRKKSNSTAKITRTEFSGEFSPTEMFVRGPEKTVRKNICLNGLWDFQPVYGPYNFLETSPYGIDAPDTAPDLPDVTDNWESSKIKIPSPWNQTEFFPRYPDRWVDAKMGWLRKRFKTPENWGKSRVILYFEAVSGDCKVVLNGEELGGNFDSTLPFEFDITDKLKKGGLNELLVGIRSADLFVKEAKYGKRPYPPGGSRRMIGIWQDVHLIALPDIYISDVFIQPDVSGKILKAEITVRNTTSESQKVKLDAQVNEWINLTGKDSLSAPEIKWELGSKQLDFKAVKITIPANSEKNVSIQTAVNGELQLWDIYQPNLYGLTSNLSRRGEIKDIKYERFGWREFTIRGNEFFLNGKSVKLFGDSQHLRNSACLSRRFAWSWYNLLKQTGGNAVRLHALVYPRHFHDMADEMGILLLPESSIYASQCDLNYESELFWKAAGYNIEGMVKKYRNHACVFGWSIENEVLPALNVKCNDPEFKQLVYDGMGELADICRRNDPTREWISGDGSKDMDGRLPVYISHYGSTTSYKEESSATSKPYGIGEACIAYYSTPRQSEMYVGDRAYRSYDDHQDAIAIDAYELLTVQRKVGVFCSIWNLGFYGVEKLPLGLSGNSEGPENSGGVYFTRPYKEGKPGIQIEYIPPNTTKYNPGYDSELPMYKKLPLFYAVKAAFNLPEPKNCEWDHRQIYKSPYPVNTDSPIKEILFLGSSKGDAYYKLTNAGLPLSKSAFDAEILLVDCDTEGLSKKSIEIIQNTIQKKGKVLFWNLSPDNLHKMDTILPCDLELVERKATALMKDEHDELVASISYKDLYFSENSDSKLIMKYGMEGDFLERGKSLLMASPIDWSKKNMNKKQENPAFFELPTENGTYYLSTIDIDILTPAHIRFISQLFQNFGVKVNPVEIRRGSVLDQISQLNKALVSKNFPASSVEEGFSKDFIEGEQTIQPELGNRDASDGWKLHEAIKGKFDFSEKNMTDKNNKYKVKYLSYWVYSPRPLDEILANPDVPQIDLEISSASAALVRINGKEIYKAMHPVEAKSIQKIPFKKGWNHFMVKLIGESENLDFSARFVSEDSQLLSSLRSALNPYSDKANFSRIKHTDSEIIYDQYWGLQGDGWYESATPGAKASFKFYGTGIQMTGLVFPNGGKAKLYLDGEFEKIIDYKSDFRDPKGVFYTKTGLNIGEHEIVLEVIDGWVALGPYEQWESYHITP